MCTNFNLWGSAVDAKKNSAAVATVVVDPKQKQAVLDSIRQVFLRGGWPQISGEPEPVRRRVRRQACRMVFAR